MIASLPALLDFYSVSMPNLQVLNLKIEIFWKYSPAECSRFYANWLFPDSNQSRGNSEPVKTGTTRCVNFLSLEKCTCRR